MKLVLEQPEFAARYLAAIVESSSDAIIGTDLSGIITIWNEGAAALYGYSQDEVVGQHVRLVIPESHRHESPHNAERVRRGERVEPFETVRVRKDGTLVDVSLAMSPIADRDGQIIGLASVTRDISDLRRAMAALEQRVAFEQLVIQISSEFINLDPADTDVGIDKALAGIGTFDGVERSYVFLFSPDRTTMDNTHEWCAPGVTSQLQQLQAVPMEALPVLSAQVLRGGVAQVPSVAALAEFAPVDAALLQSQDIQALALVPLISRGVPIGLLGFDSVRVEHPWSDDTIRLLVMVGQVFVNALERKWAAEALRERELQYRSIFEATSDGLVITTADDTGRVLDANPSMCRMHGYTATEFIGRSRRDFIHPDWWSSIDAYRTSIQTGGDYRLRAVDVRKDGSLLHVEVHGTRILYQGEPAVLGVVRDITSDVQAYELLEQRVAERTQELSLLLDISRDVASTLELQPLLELILDQVKPIIDYTGSAILTLDGPDLIIAGQRGPREGRDVRHIRYPVAKLAPLWERMHRGEAINIQDIRGNTLEARVFRDVVGDQLDDRYDSIVECLWVPLIVKERLIGIMSIASLTPNIYEPRQIDMVVAIARQAAVAIDNARLHEQAQGKAALEERQKLARELHDSVSQALYGIALGAQTIRRLLDRDPAKAVAPTDYVLSLAEAGMAEMRALIFELRPESLQTEGLAEALRKQSAALRARYGIAITTSLHDEPDVPLDIKEALYRIAQEAMHNTVKHAKATEVSIRLEAEQAGIVLEVTDNGRGFDPSASFPGHLGLQSMRERVSPFGGHLDVISSPGAGVRVIATVPVR